MNNYQKEVIDLKDKLIMAHVEFTNMVVVFFLYINRCGDDLNMPTTIATQQIITLCKENNIKLTE